MNTKNYIFVGLGPHTKRIYYPFLEKHKDTYNICLKLLVELENQKQNVEKYLVGRSLQPERILYLPVSKESRMGDSLCELAKRELDALIKMECIDGIIISTEPKAHRIYAEWALRNNINVLMDKPITTPLYPSTDINAAKQIYGDYLDLEQLRRENNAKAYVVCQRRNHEGYVYIKDYLRKFISDFQIPVSFVDIYHADGAWSLPHEFMKENHPYKYGYGKLMHSGYHFVDLFSWLVDVNNQLDRIRPDFAKLHTARFTPNDLFNQIDERTLNKIYNNPKISEFYKTYNSQNYNYFGELDAYTFVQLMRGNNVITSGSINLQQNSFSRRGWFDLPEDTYKGNGRVRHERVNIQVSHFLNIQVHSYQSCEVGKEVAPAGVVGSEDHFDINIFRNKKVIGGDAFAKISVGGKMKKDSLEDRYYLGHNEKAREVTLLNFIEGKDDESELQYHDFTNNLLSNIYQSIERGQRMGNSQLTFKI
ncbi:MAG: Gfo/Idh/MocA family oxidoreductase [Candidatus Vogelbacteria bacterium]|nr:Gfo/Idh/MocA family oxidoreductase [Candidatus Vogelbacteria bacterium]